MTTPTMITASTQAASAISASGSRSLPSSLRGVRSRAVIAPSCGAHALLINDSAATSSALPNHHIGVSRKHSGTPIATNTNAFTLAARAFSHAMTPRVLLLVSSVMKYVSEANP
jgi:hypothetical protein